MLYYRCMYHHGMRHTSMGFFKSASDQCQRRYSAQHKPHNTIIQFIFIYYMSHTQCLGFITILLGRLYCWFYIRNSTNSVQKLSDQLIISNTIFLRRFDRDLVGRLVGLWRSNTSRFNKPVLPNLRSRLKRNPDSQLKALEAIESKDDESWMRLARNRTFGETFI